MANAERAAVVHGSKIQIPCFDAVWVAQQNDNKLLYM